MKGDVSTLKQIDLEAQGRWDLGGKLTGIKLGLKTPIEPQFLIAEQIVNPCVAYVHLENEDFSSIHTDIDAGTTSVAGAGGTRPMRTRRDR
jgi:hypothetical protein